MIRNPHVGAGQVVQRLSPAGRRTSRILSLGASAFTFALLALVRRPMASDEIGTR
ncbi:hypothetical protein [Pelomicrobium sp. G1]|uniref:hypothetical protein n=1 Tax=unclassified Pelomicrobium TaxID=2815318 RepID=UPI003F76DA85